MFFKVFDIWQDHRWLSFNEVFDLNINGEGEMGDLTKPGSVVITGLKENFLLLRWVPIICILLFNEEDLLKSSMGRITNSGSYHIRESIVVKRIKELMHRQL